MFRFLPAPSGGSLWSPAAPSPPVPSLAPEPHAAPAQGGAPPGAMGELFGHLAETRKDLEALAVRIFEAADGAGSDEKAIFSALDGLAPAEALRLRAIYADHYAGRSLDLELVD